MILFTTFVLTGCDLFGGATTIPTTVATTAVTTAATTAATTVATTAATTAVTTATTTAVITAVTTATTTQATTAATTQTTTQATTAATTQTTTQATTAATTQTTTQTTTTAATTTVTTTEVVIVTYTVTFYDSDGVTVLSIQEIEEGSAAIAPDNPYKPEDGTSAYSFDGWDVGFGYITSDLMVTAVYVAVPFNTTFNVTFFDADDNVINVQTVLIGEDAFPPMPPMKATDAQYTYAFAGWDNAITNVSSDLEIRPTFSGILNQYTVTFYDWDGTELDQQMVNFGTPAAPPADPTRLDDAEYSYSFIGWDNSINNVHMNMEATAVYFRTSLLAFNHGQLVQIVDELFNPYDVEEQIIELLVLFGSATEEDLYDELLVVQQMMMQLQFMSSATEFQAWYLGLATNGFPQQRLVSMFSGAMLVGMTNDLDRYAERMLEAQNAIDAATQEISDMEAMIAQLQQQVADYCISTSYPAVCQDYWNGHVMLFHLQDDYFSSINEHEFDDEWDIWTYYDLEYDLDQIFFYTHWEINEVSRQEYQDSFDTTWNSLSLEEQQRYEPYLDDLEAMNLTQYNIDNEDWSVLSTLDSNNDYIIDVLDNWMWGYQDEFNNYVDGYVDYINDLVHPNWILSYNTRRLEELEDELASQQVIVDYLTDNQADVMALMNTAYGTLEAVMMTVDDEMFDFAMSIIQSMFMNPEFDERLQMSDPEPYSPFGPFAEFITPENITMVMGKLANIMEAVQLSLDPTDYANIKTVALGFLDDKFTAEGMDPIEEAAFLVVIGLKIDTYFGYFDFALGDLSNFFTAFDENKAEAVLRLTNMDFFKELTPIDLAIKLSQIADKLIGDDSLSIPTWFEMMTEIYFDVTTELNPDPVEVATTTAAVSLFITETLDLVAEIKDFNPTFMSPADVEAVYELMARLEAIGAFMDQGMEHVTDPLVVYQDWYLPEFLSDVLNEYDMESAIAKYLDILGVPTQEQAFFITQSIFQYVTGIIKVKDFAGLQYWMLGLESFGFTQEQLVGYFMKLMEYQMAEDALGGDWYQQDLQNILDNIADAEDEMVTYQDLMDAIDAAIAAEILLLPFGLQPTAVSYWADSKVYNELVNAYWGAYYHLEDFVLSSDMIDLDAAMTTMFNYGDTEPQYIAALATFNAIYDAASPDVQVLIDELVLIHADYMTTMFNVLDGNDALAIDPSTSTFRSMVDDQGSTYYMYQQYYLDAVWEVNYWTEEQAYLLDEMMQGTQMPLFMQEFLGDPVNNAAMQVVMNILLDEMQNMVGTMPADSFEMIPMLIEMMQQSFEPRFNLSMEPEEPQEFVMPFSASDIFDFTQDMSMLLKLRGGTLTTVETAQIEALITTFITGYVATMDMDPVDAAAMVTMMNDIVLKYINFADLTLTELTDFLDGLTLEKVQMVMDYAMAISRGEYNIYQQIVLGTQMINSVLDTAIVDVNSIVDMYLEVYMDINYEFDYDPADLVTLKDAWGTYLDDLFTAIDDAALLDAMALDPADFADLYDLQQAVMYLGMLFDNPEGIYDFVGFGYSHDDFVNLVYNIFDDVDPSSVEDRIVDLTLVFNMLEEDTYYLLLGIGSQFMNLRDVKSITDIANIYNGLLSLGLDNEAIAEYVMNGIMMFVYPNLLDMSDTTDLEAQLAGYEISLQNVQSDYDMVNQSVLDLIGQIADPLLRDAMYNYWYAYVEWQSAYAHYNYSYENYSWHDNFDYYLFQNLKGLAENGDYSQIDEMLNNLPENEYWMYRDLINTYTNYLNNMQVFDIVQGDFFSNWSDPYLTDVSEYFSNYVANRYELYNDMQQIVQYQDMIYQLQDEIERMEDSAWVYAAMHDFLGDTGNISLAEASMVILLDEIAANITNPNMISIEAILMILPEGNFMNLNPAQISAELINLGGLMNGLFSTLDAADIAVLNLLVDTIIPYALDNTMDPVDAAIAAPLIQGVIDTYFEGFFDVPGYLGDFLLTMDEAKTAAVWAELMTIMMPPTGNPELDGQLMIIAIGSIVDTLFSDDSLNYTALTNNVLKFVYDFSLLQGNTNPDTAEAAMLEFLALVEDVLDQAALVALVDAGDIQPADVLVLQELKDAVDALQLFLDTMITDGIPV